jgi:AraC family transcriptional regulator, regulatory protein of adaptative response / methylated-DNA-[protein]-cysteine methyltransferase
VIWTHNSRWMMNPEYKSKSRSVGPGGLRQSGYHLMGIEITIVTVSPRKTRNRSATINDPRWQKVVERDLNADGTFWYGVATTGVYCKPSCGSRRADPENVTFYLTQTEAMQAGFRACKRCRPNGLGSDEENALIVAKACRLIENSDPAPSLTALAKAVDLSPSYFHRVFKEVTGVTPKAYASAHRADRVRKHLTKATSVTDAIYDSGFNSSGRFYEQSTGMLGMTPRRFRAGGANEELRFAVGQCSLGAILVASSEKGVASILLGEDPEMLVRDLQDQFPQATIIGGNKEYEALIARVVGFVEAPAIGLDLPLDVRGTAFQQRVWKALREIPVGQTASYQHIAREIGSPRAIRAVAGACAANAIAVAIPCHRVVRRDGSLSGYRWGIERKRALIDREART